MRGPVVVLVDVVRCDSQTVGGEIVVFKEICAQTFRGNA